MKPGQFQKLFAFFIIILFMTGCNASPTSSDMSGNSSENPDTMMVNTEEAATLTGFGEPGVIPDKIPTVENIIWDNFPKSPNTNLTTTGKTWSVSVMGKDSNAGSESLPLRTINKAISLARTGDKILIHAGTYNEQDIQTGYGLFISTPGLIITNSPGETVTIKPKNGATYGIGIRANNVTLNGLIVSGFSSVSIDMDSPSPMQNTVLKNMTIRSLDYGIAASQIDGFLMENVLMTGAKNVALLCDENCNDVRVNNLTIRNALGGPADCVYWYSGSNLVFYNADISACTSVGLNLTADDVLIANSNIHNLSGNGIILDHGGDIENTVVSNTGNDSSVIYTHPGKYRIMNSVVAYNGAAGPYVLMAGYDFPGDFNVELTNNVFYSVSGPLYFPNPSGLTVNNNAFSAFKKNKDSKGIGELFEIGSTGDVSHNPNFLGLSNMAFASDPGLFVNPTTTPRNWSPKMGSPLIDAGMIPDSTTCPDTDALRKNRMVGAEIDMGAIEFQGSSSAGGSGGSAGGGATGGSGGASTGGSGGTAGAGGIIGTGGSGGSAGLGGSAGGIGGSSTGGTGGAAGSGTAGVGGSTSLTLPTTAGIDFAKFPKSYDATKAVVGKTWYVDGTNGNDTNPGTLASPLRSINTAVSLAGTAGDKILVRAGTYKLGISGDQYALVFDKNNLTLTNYPGETVILTPNSGFTYGLRILGNNTILNGFTIQGFNTVSIELGGNGTIKNNVLSNLNVQAVAEGIVNYQDNGGSYTTPTIDGLLMENVTINNAIALGFSCNAGPCNSVYMKNVKVSNRATASGNSGSDCIAFERGDNLVFNHAESTGCEADGLDLKATKVLVYDSYFHNLARNGLKLWLGGDVQNTIVSNTGADGAVIFDGPGAYRMINSVVANHLNGAPGSYTMTIDYDTTCARNGAAKNYCCSTIYAGRCGNLTVDFANNVFLGDSGPIFTPTSTGLSVKNSVFASFAEGDYFEIRDQNGQRYNNPNLFGSGNLAYTTPPALFVNSAVNANPKDWRAAAGSPLINGGIVPDISTFPVFDMNDGPRVLGGRVDIGPIENQ